MGHHDRDTRRAARRLQWQRLDSRAQLVFPIAGFALIALAARGSGGGVGGYVSLFTLMFVLVGFSQRLGTCVALMPVALVTLWLGVGELRAGARLVELVFDLLVAVVSGESVALVLRRQRRAEARMERLLDAVRVLVRITDEREGAEVLAVLAADLVEADAAAVYLAARHPAQRFLSKAWSGHPALADSAPLLVDAARLHPGRVEVFADAVEAGLVTGARGSRARAAALVALPGEGAPIGAITLLWAKPRRGLSGSARQAAELLSQEAGRMFTRMRAAAALTIEAETDPLTSLANRRTFSRALDTLSAGDALVVVDLDHFKSVNDTYGHAAGDETLRRLAVCLRSVGRQVDCVARYGGEEFALVLVDAKEAGARVALHRLRRAWEATRPLTTFSAGVAIHAAGDASSVTLHRADLALYRAKDAGRDRFEVAEREIVLS